MKNLTGKIAVIAASVAIGCQAAVAQQTTVERPVLKPGTEWSYRIDNSKRDKPTPPSDLRRVVKAVNANDYTIDVVTPTGTRTTVMSLDLNPFAEGMTTGANKATGALPYFSFPMTPGKTYSEPLSYPSPFGNLAIQVDMNTKVLDWEEVTVPAGKYRALKVEANGRSVGGPINGTRKVTLWYAPEVGNYVRMEFEISYSPVSGKSVHELTAFSLK